MRIQQVRGSWVILPQGISRNRIYSFIISSVLLSDHDDCRESRELRLRHWQKSEEFFVSKVFSLYDFFRKNIIEIYEFIFITFYCENNSQFENSAEMFFSSRRKWKMENAEKIRAQRRNVLTDFNKKWFIWKRWGLMLHPKKDEKSVFLAGDFSSKALAFQVVNYSAF